MKTHIPFCEPYRPTCCLNADSSRLRGLGPALRARCARFTLRRSRQTELSYAEGPCPRHCCARAGLVQPWPPSRLPGLLCPRADRTPCSLLHRPRISDEISFLSVSKLTPGGVLVGSTLPLPPPPPSGQGSFPGLSCDTPGRRPRVHVWSPRRDGATRYLGPCRAAPRLPAPRLPEWPS